MEMNQTLKEKITNFVKERQQFIKKNKELHVLSKIDQVTGQWRSINPNTRNPKQCHITPKVMDKTTGRSMVNFFIAKFWFC